MIRPALIFFTAATLVCLTACESDQQEKPKPHRFGYPGGNGTEVAPTGDNGAPPPSSGVGTSPDNGGPIAPPPQPPPPPPTTGQSNNGAGTGATQPQKADYPYAQPVPGKQGFVISPYAPGSGYVDVRGFAPGTEVKDPYTQKIFLVP